MYMKVKSQVILVNSISIMEPGQQTDILCKNSEEKFKDVLYELFESKNYSDVTLICDDKISINAHRNILGSYSPVFKNILDQENKFAVKTGSVFLHGVASNEMLSVLEFIYLGETNCKLSKVNDLLELANDLQLQGFEVEYGKDKIEAQVDDKIVAQVEVDDKEKILNEKKDDELGIDKDPKTIGDGDAAAIKSTDELKCDDVDFTTISKYTLKMADSGLYMCILGCKGALYSIPSRAIRHYASNHDQSMLRYKCDICAYTCFDKYAINTHKQTHIKEVKCNKCGFWTKQQKSLDRHVKKECMSLMKECLKCGQLFSSAKRLKHHEASIHGMGHMCDVCGKIFECLESKEKHINNHHRILRFF